MVNKVLKYIKNPSLLFNFMNNRNMLNWMSDKLFLKIQYYISIGEKLNLGNPQKFNEKLQWLKLNDRNIEYSKMVDKYEVKKYITNIIGEQYVIPLLGVYDSFDDIDFKKLPNQFVLKCTHNSGGVIICKDKNNFNFSEARVILKKGLKNNYFYQSREWVYKAVTPRIIVEKYLQDDNKLGLNDYKFFCFNGKVKIVLVCSNRTKRLKKTWYDENWNLLNLVEGDCERDLNIKKPLNFNKMKELAEILARKTTFVRIDFYESNNKIYFGEITFFPHGGYEKFNPKEYDKILGDMIDLKKLKNNKKGK